MRSRTSFGTASRRPRFSALAQGAMSSLFCVNSASSSAPYALSFAICRSVRALRYSSRACRWLSSELIIRRVSSASKLALSAAPSASTSSSALVTSPRTSIRDIFVLICESRSSTAPASIAKSEPVSFLGSSGTSASGAGGGGGVWACANCLPVNPTPHMSANAASASQARLCLSTIETRLSMDETQDAVAPCSLRVW